MTTTANTPDPLIDRFGRIHDSVRISVTDRCNIRCFYCMPELNAEFMPRGWLLSFEEIHRLATLLVQRCGVRDLRVTGGEPLVRRELNRLIAMLASIDGVEDLSLTTNGILLAEQAKLLRDAGLKRLNISLDTLDESTFERISRRKGLSATIAGIDAAIECGFESIKLNTIAFKGVTENEIVRLVRFAAERDVVIRFIEFMPLDSDQAWKESSVLSGDDILKLVSSEFGDAVPVDRSHVSQPAEDFVLPGGGRFGIIRSVTQPFCAACNRLRITADGAIRNCLFSQQEFPLRDKLRAGASDDELLQVIRDSIDAKKSGHGIDADGFTPPQRPMYSIGG